MNFGNIKAEIASNARMNLNDTAHATLIKRWINMVYKHVNGLYNWPWLYGRKIIQTEDETSISSVGVSSGGTTVTAASGSFSSGDVNKYIQFSSSDDWYKITAVTGTTQCTIEAAYTQSSDLSDGTATIRKVFYSLGSDVDTVLTIKQAITPCKLSLIFHTRFDEYLPNITSTGDPTLAHIWGYDSNDYWQFVLYPIPDSTINLEVRYKKKTTNMTADDDTPSIPDKWADNLLVSGALVKAYLYNKQHKDAIFAKREFKDFLSGMKDNFMPETSSHPIMENQEVGRQERVEIPWPDDFGP